MECRADRTPTLADRRAVADFCGRLRDIAADRLRRPAYIERFRAVCDAADGFVRNVRCSGNGARATGFADAAFTPDDVTWARRQYAEILVGVDEGSRSRIMRFALVTSLIPGIREMLDLLHLALAIEMGYAVGGELAARVVAHADASVARWSEIGDHARKIGVGEQVALSDEVLVETFRTYLRLGSYGAAAADLGLATHEAVRLRLESGEARGLFPRLDRVNSHLPLRLSDDHIRALVARHGTPAAAAYALGVSRESFANEVSARGIAEASGPPMDISPGRQRFDGVVERLNPRHVRTLARRHGSVRAIARALCVGVPAVGRVIEDCGAGTALRVVAGRARAFAGVRDAGA